MKTKLLLLLAGLMLCFSACMTTDPVTRERVYDQVKTDTVKAALKPVVSGSITAVLLNNPTKKEEYGAYFRSVGNVFCNMRVSGEFTPSFLIREVERLTLQLQSQAPPLVLVAKQSLIGLYEAFYAQKVRAELPPDKWPAHVADLFCDAIDTALKDSGLQGVPAHPVQ